jgi:hypothetical protein
MSGRQTRFVGPFEGPLTKTHKHILEVCDEAVDSWKRAVAEVSSSVDRRMIWAMEVIAITALVLITRVMPNSHHDALIHLALGICGLMISGSAFVGAYILADDPKKEADEQKIGPTRSRPAVEPSSGYSMR